MKGKSYAHKSNKDNDSLPTPFSATIQIIEKFGIENLHGTILEPCCGKFFAIAQILTHYYKRENLFFQDKAYIQSPKYNYKQIDFLLSGCEDGYIVHPLVKYDWIFTNPPFSLWDDWIRKSRIIALQGFILIGKLQFLTGKDRFDTSLYYPGNYNLKTVYNFTRQCDWRVPLRKTGTYPAGMQHYTAYYFKNGYSGKAEIEFIDNQEFIKK